MKVVVAGFFDLFHSGHLAFLEEAAQFGELFVSIGSDRNLEATKNKKAIYTEEERLYIVSALKCVAGAEVSLDLGAMSFVSYMRRVGADVFVTNEDGSHLDEKKRVCEEVGVRFVQLKRVPQSGMPMRSSTSVAAVDRIPHRLDLVGFYDQVAINRICPGSVVLANIETIDADDRSGMSSSTRHVIRKIFGNRLPRHMSCDELAKITFAVENAPGSQYTSGVVDHLGVCVPGINALHFDNGHWPYKTESICDPDVCAWLSNHVFLRQTVPRPLGYSVLDGREHFTREKVKRHSELGVECWRAIVRMDVRTLGEVVNAVHESQRDMIPGYESEEVAEVVRRYRSEYAGVKLMGAGGYGYMMVVSEAECESGIKVSVRTTC